MNYSQNFGRWLQEQIEKHDQMEAFLMDLRWQINENLTHIQSSQAFYRRQVEKLQNANQQYPDAPNVEPTYRYLDEIHEE